MISVQDQAAYVILNILSAQMFMVPKGLAEATCVVIGNAVGSNNVKLAVRSYKLTFGVTVAFILLIVVVVSLAKS